MGRSVPAGARVLLESKPRPRPGQVWVFVNDDGELIAHRCIAQRDKLYLFQGDAAADPDPPIAATRLVAAVRAIDRDQGPVRQLRRPAAASHVWWWLRRLERRGRRRVILSLRGLVRMG